MPFTTASISIDPSGLFITLGFTDFNSASGNLILTYTPGSIKSPPILPDTLMQAWSLTFVPVELVPPDVGVPEVLEVFNV